MAMIPIYSHPICVNQLSVASMYTLNNLDSNFLDLAEDVRSFIYL